ncbi:MAG: sulfite exporter TauE/SafE family protein [Coriobacteriia bacterium]
MTSLFLSMFALGLATSLHCIGMCGPMVVTYAVKGEEDGPWHKKLVPNLAYQAAKITSYVIVGLALGAIGSAFNLDGIRPWIMFAAGAFMIILGLGMTGKVPWAARLTPRPPKFLITALSNLRRKAKTDADEDASTLATPVAFGLLTGFMPCAPLQGAEIAAAATGSVLLGGTAMLAFGLGTMPLMLAFGTASSLIPKDWKHRLSIMLAVVVMAFGLVFINRAAMLVGSPVTFNTVKNAVVGGTPSASTPATAYKTGADGVVEVPFSIINTRYVPDSVSIPADKPVRLLLDRQEDVACSDRLVIKQLGIDVALAPNAVTTIDLPATAAGTYSMTCGMGMMSGQLVVGGSSATAGRSSSGSPLLWLLVAVVAGAGAIYLARRNPPEAQRNAKAPAKKKRKS